MSLLRSPAKALLLAILLCSCIILPVFAATPILPSIGLDEQYIDGVYALNYNVTPGLAVAGIEIRVPYETLVDFSVNGGSNTGSIHYTGTAITSTETIVMGANTQSFYLPGNVLHPASLHHIGVAFNQTGERGYYVDTEILTSYANQIAYETIPGALPITVFSFTSNNPVNVKIITESYEKGYADLAPGGFGDIPGYIPGTDTVGGIPGEILRWIQFAADVSLFVWGFMGTLFAWIKFFFDNIVLIFALYLTLTMAFAARAARGNIAKFLRQWFKDQIGLVRFLIELVTALVNIPATIRRIFP